MVRGIWVDRKNLLDNPMRREIYTSISNSPGVGEEEIFRATDLDHGRVRRHIELLINWGYIFRDSRGGYRVSITSPVR